MRDAAPTAAAVTQGVSRRGALLTVVGLAGYIYGRPSLQAQGRQVMTIALDGVTGIQVIYQGQRVVITPAEVMAALGGKDVLDSPSGG